MFKVRLGTEEKRLHSPDDCSCSVNGMVSFTNVYK